jgi:hypothetical protein
MSIISKIRILVLISLGVVMTCHFSCKKSGTNCFTNSGQVVREIRGVSGFDSIDLEDNVNLILKDDSVFKIEVEAGKNLLDGIITKVENRQLVIRNNNVCNWLRSYSDPINVYASVRNLSKIYYNSAGDISTINPITSGNFTVEIWGGAGVVDLNLDIHGYGHFFLQMGSADFVLHGACNIVNLYGGDYGLIQAKNLQTDIAYVTNRGTNDIYVRARKLLDASIQSIGNIYYTGNPDSLIIKKHGSGEVIPF